MTFYSTYAIFLRSLLSCLFTAKLQFVICDVFLIWSTNWKQQIRLFDKYHINCVISITIINFSKSRPKQQKTWSTASVGSDPGETSFQNSRTSSRRLMSTGLTRPRSTLTSRWLDTSYEPSHCYGLWLLSKARFICNT